MSAERTHIPGQLSVEELEKLAHVYAAYGGGGYGESEVTEDEAEDEGAVEDSEEEEEA